MVEAEYQLTRCENVWSMSVPLWTVLPLSRDRTFLYGIVPECDVIGRVEGQGGRKNHTIDFFDQKSAWPMMAKEIPVEGAWVMSHLGHSLPILVNGEPTMRWHLLRTGDVVSPGPGIEFTFSLTAHTAPVLALERVEGPTIFERLEPLIDRVIELHGCTPDHAVRIVAAASARTRGSGAPPR